jgi:ABC-type phosphate/phosphonate transport system permease subunit
MDFTSPYRFMKSKVVVNTATLVIVALAITMLGLLVAVPLQALATPSIPIPPPSSIKMFHEQSIVTSPTLLLR